MKHKTMLYGIKLVMKLVTSYLIIGADKLFIGSCSSNLIQNETVAADDMLIKCPLVVIVAVLSNDLP